MEHATKAKSDLKEKSAMIIILREKLANAKINMDKSKASEKAVWLHSEKNLLKMNEKMKEIDNAMKALQLKTNEEKNCSGAAEIALVKINEDKVTARYYFAAKLKDNNKFKGPTEGTLEGTDNLALEDANNGTLEGLKDSTGNATLEGTIKGVVNGSNEFKGSTEGTLEGSNNRGLQGAENCTLEKIEDRITNSTDETTMEGTTEGVVVFNGKDDSKLERTTKGTLEGMDAVELEGMCYSYSCCHNGLFIIPN